MAGTTESNADAEPFGSELLVRKQLASGLLKIGQAIRSHSWAGGEELGLTPTQGQVLGLLLHHQDRDMRVGDIAHELSVAQPTASVAIRSLVTKGFVEKSTARNDARAVALRLTPIGRNLAMQSQTWTDFLLNAIEELDPEEQAVFQRATIKMIRSMQERGQVPIARMCVTCTHFRPNVNDDELSPHHCALVGADFGDRQLRLDCPEHTSAASEKLAEMWLSFSAGAS